jgi:hypothetical protein
MDEQRKKLLELLETLNFPLTPDEMEEKVKGLTDEEVADLVSVYTDIVKYEDELEDYVRDYHPDEYKKLVDEREEIIKKKDKEELYELEREQENIDIELDAKDAKTQREVEEIVSGQERNADVLEKLEEDIENTLNLNQSDVDIALKSGTSAPGQTSAN